MGALSEAWALAIEALYHIESRRLNERLALLEASKHLNIRTATAIGLAHKLVIETVRRQNYIDALIDSALRQSETEPKLSLGTLNPRLRAFLRLFTYESKTSEPVSYERVVKLAEIGRSILGWRRMMIVESTLGLLWGLKESMVLQGLGNVEKTSLTVFQNPWFVKYCFRLFGRRVALDFFRSSMMPPPTYVRINTLKMSEDEILTALSDDGISLTKVGGLSHSYEVVDQQGLLTRTTSFEQGLFSLQDKASSLAVEIAAPEPGMTVIDACAAPGGKTTYLAQLMRNRGEIYSVDYSRRRMALLCKEVNRLGVEICKPLVGDLCNPLPMTKIEADLILLDPPCTSTGVIGKAPSTKWRISKRSISNMAKLQWTMLSNCVEAVADGGTIVYCTCSVTVEENEMIIERFLKLNPDFKPVEPSPWLGVPALRSQSFGQRLYPNLHRSNGFFVAKLQASA
ncbi:MAG: RsmB/NOP family class I SAM-dependent RNA methyltransferase [Candidatus Bathyarchaeota archaeon]|nr:MAG: RsmB/NOP family class I SAM-dependent RNA methyltransferase [Candidatus Bathyarchaeota archaeon]